ncbi:MAG TPA: tetratricopeptide repeat protein [Steroidobacteraceae bacterium]|nr:tetratricopeptide repeat protein [Steroidobacteraceae bacterium]
MPRGATILGGVLLLAALAACSVTPKRVAEHGAMAAAVHSTPAKPSVDGKSAQSGAGAGPPPVPAEARDKFENALALAHGGNDAAAEAQLQRLAQQYPQFSTPLVDLGILRRKDGNLAAAAKALEDAVARDPHSASAWTELGITQRLGGKFQDAEQSYARAIAADPAYAPAYRDRGVLLDLYLDQPAAALADFEQYRKLARADKPVAMWIAELSHRTGLKVPPPDTQPPAAAAAASGPTPAAVTPAPAPPPRARN